MLAFFIKIIFIYKCSNNIMENNNKYILQWRDLVLKASKAMEEKNFELCDTLMNEAQMAYENYKKDTEMTYDISNEITKESVNFGVMNHIFEDALPTLFKKNPKAVKEFISTIKEDKNLLYQFQFYKALEKYNKDINSKDYINEALEIVKNNINKKTITESNGKLAKIISAYNIKPIQRIPDESVELYESCDFLFKREKVLTNLREINEKLNKVINYTEKYYDFTNEGDTKNLFSMVENFEKKYNSLLNEEEKDFVKEIMNFKKGEKDEKKEKLFNRFKNECLNTINKLISESDSDDKEGLLAIKEQIMEKEYCAETLVRDMAKLLEIRDILMS